MVAMPQQVQEPNGPLDRILSVAQWVSLLGPVALLPWMFGGVTPVAQLVLAATVLVSLLLWLARLRTETPPLPTLLLPLLLAIALGLLQLLPLGNRLQSALSPQAAQFWEAATPREESEQQFRAELGDWTQSRPTTASLYPAATRYDLALLVLAAGLVFLGAQVFSTPGSQKVLWGVIAANGALFAFFGLTQHLTWKGKIYGQFPLSEGGDPFAAFVNKNNGAGHLNLCLAAALGFLLCAYLRRRSSSGSPTGLYDAPREDTNPLQRIGQAIGELNGTKLFAVTAVALLVVGVVSTLSRGGWIGMAAGLTVVTTALAHSRRTAWLAWTGLVVLLMTLGLIQYLGRSDAIEARWQKLVQQFEEPSDGRLEHWSDSWRTGQNFLLLGTGLGTYRYAYLPYTQVHNRKLFYHAENQYIEALTVGGVVGLVLLLATIGMGLVACLRLLREPRESTAYVAGIVGLYALVSQSVSALFDFGLYLPANMALLALLMGSVAGRAARVLPEHHRAAYSWRRFLLPPVAFPSLPALAPVLGTLLLCAGLWGMAELQRAGAAETAVRTTRVLREGREAELPDVERSIQQLAQTLEARPDDVDAQQALAQMLVHRYRLRMFRVLRWQRLPDETDESLWQRTTPLALHGAVYRYLSEGRTIELENLRRSEWVQSDLRQAARALVAATRASPLPASPLLLLAELAPVVSEHMIDAELLEHCRNRAGGDHELLLECGFVELQAGRTEQALADIRRSAEANPVRVAVALRAAAPWIPAERLVREGLPEQPELLVKLARDDFKPPEYAELRHALLERGTELLEETGLEPAERYQLEGVILALRDQVDEAVERQKQAVNARPEKSAWRFQLALLLRQQGDVELAWEHARTCVRMEPDNKRYEALLQELIRARLTSR